MYSKPYQSFILHFVGLKLILKINVGHYGNMATYIDLNSCC